MAACIAPLKHSITRAWPAGSIKIRDSATWLSRGHHKISEHTRTPENTHSKKSVRYCTHNTNKELCHEVATCSLIVHKIIASAGDNTSGRSRVTTIALHVTLWKSGFAIRHTWTLTHTCMCACRHPKLGTRGDTPDGARGQLPTSNAARETGMHPPMYS